MAVEMVMTRIQVIMAAFLLALQESDTLKQLATNQQEETKEERKISQVNLTVIRVTWLTVDE